MKDPKNIALLIISIAFVVSITFMNNENRSQSKTIDRLNEWNEQYKQSDSILKSKIDSLELIQDSIRTKRDTFYITIYKTHERTRQEITRIDTTHIDTLLRELSDRYRSGSVVSD